MKKLYIYAGIAASCVMICIGIGSIVVGFNGRDTVRDELARENIVGTPDMKSVANEKIDTGQEARDFAAGMRVHTLEDTNGQTYAEMPRFLDENGKPTHDEKAAAVDPKSGEPVTNPARNIWVTETALTTALNTSYFAESVATFSIVMGFALLLAGIGFLVLTLRLPWRGEQPEEAASKTPAGQPVLAS
jgi:ABC-type Na+ efflux pump permease subunit